MFGKNKTFCFIVEGIECENCKARVERAVLGVKGVKKADARIDNGEVTVEAKKGVTEDEIKSAILAAGYKV